MNGLLGCANAFAIPSILFVRAMPSFVKDLYLLPTSCN